MIYVLSDIHGNMRRFKSVMKQIKLQPEDTLYVLGDVIDRHPDGIKILRQLMTMPNVQMLLGNHEYMMLEALDYVDNPDDASKTRKQERAKRLWYSNGGWITHYYIKHIRKTIRKEIFDFLRSLPVNIDVTVGSKKYKLVHGSPIENLSLAGRYYDSDKHFAVWNRWEQCDPVPDGYTLIFGHTPTAHFIDEIPLRIWFDDNAIGIDCGSGYPEGGFYKGVGRLACLRLDDMKTFYSEEEGIDCE